MRGYSAKYLNGHIADKIEAARLLQELAKQLPNEEHRRELANVISLLTRTPIEIWGGVINAQV